MTKDAFNKIAQGLLEAIDITNGDDQPGRVHVIRYSNEPITRLAPNEVFVFGSNLAGRHGKGAALQAVQFGAVYGRGWGHYGQTYAIPTKDSQLRTLPIRGIRIHVDIFIAYTYQRNDLTFRLTKIGCGLAGYKEEQIAPLFAHAPPNVIRPEGW